MTRYLLQTLFVLILFAACFPGIDGDSDSRDLQVLYDVDVNLTCADGNFNPDSVHNATFQWLLPNGQLLPSSSTLNMSHHYTVLDNGVTVIISDVDRPDFGLYLCLVSIDGVVQASVRWTMNIDGPYYGDMWDKYWPKTKVALMAAAAMFIFLSMLCINLDQYQNDFDKRETERKRRKLQPYFSDQRMTNQGYTNAAFSHHLPSSLDSAGMAGIDSTEAEDINHDSVNPQEQESKTSF